eukprot:Skav222538  [mRNA]  locus=scaffold2875:212130:213188:+ [translate_table: standard]
MAMGSETWRDLLQRLSSELESQFTAFQELQGEHQQLLESWTLQGISRPMEPSRPTEPTTRPQMEPPSRPHMEPPTRANMESPGGMEDGVKSFPTAAQLKMGETEPRGFKAFGVQPPEVRDRDASNVVKSRGSNSDGLLAFKSLGQRTWG